MIKTQEELTAAYADPKYQHAACSHFVKEILENLGLFNIKLLTALVDHPERTLEVKAEIEAVAEAIDKVGVKVSFLALLITVATAAEIQLNKYVKLAEATAKPGPDPAAN